MQKANANVSKRERTYNFGSRALIGEASFDLFRYAQAHRERKRQFENRAAMQEIE